MQANLLTGLVNFSMDSMQAGDSTAFTILLGYTAVLVAIAHALRNRRLKL